MNLYPYNTTYLDEIDTKTLNKVCMRNNERFSFAYDILTIGMTINALNNVGEINLDDGIEYGHYVNEEDLTDFAIELSEKWDDYAAQKMEAHEDYCWDEYIEEKIIEKYGER